MPRVVRRRAASVRPRHVLLRRWEHQVLRLLAGQVPPRRLPVEVQHPEAHLPIGPSTTTTSHRITRPPNRSTKCTARSTTPPSTGGIPSRSLRRPRTADPAGRRQAAQPRVTPSNLSLGIDLRDGGGCIRCRTCDGFPAGCWRRGRGRVRVRPAIASGIVELLTNAYADGC